jgi:NAD(P)-dependent dehydrogenase (short-subunit alcohol dehydrogenase family)
MTARAKSEWGRIDILVNNAGILRDKSFAKMELTDFRTVMDVHLMGSVHCTKAVWDIVREQNYGRIVMTTSSSGLYGNFGQSNYGSAKAGVIGLMNVLAQEGRKNDIRVNTLSPTAATRMTEDLIPAEMLALMTPESITPGLLYLVSEDAPTRTILCAGAGAFAVASVVETKGAYFLENERTPEAIAARFAEIADTTGAQALESALQQTDKFVNMAAKAKGIRLGTRNDDPR